MEIKILKISSLFLAVTIAAVLVLGYFSDTLGQGVQHGMSGLQILAYNTEQAKEMDEAEFEQQLCIELPEGMLLDDVVI